MAANIPEIHVKDCTTDELESLDTELDPGRDFEERLGTTIEHLEENHMKGKADPEKIADHIISAFIYKKPKVFDLDDQTDVISYEDSENRLIRMSFVTSIIFALSSFSMTLKIFEVHRDSTNQKIYVSQSSDNHHLHFPNPHVVFMDPIGKGVLISLKQMNRQFEFDWQFKVPAIPEDTGYFLFQDQSKIFVIPSGLESKMTMIHSSTLKHTKLRNSQIPEEFYNFSNSVRVGGFVIVFGGTHLSLPLVYKKELFCSSVKDKQLKQKAVPSTAIWSIRRQVWIKGPFLPIENSCVFRPSGFSLNRTHGVIVNIPSSHEILDQCLQAYTFSVPHFQWVDINSCLITLDLNDETRSIYLASMTTAVFFENKHTNDLSVIILCHFRNYNEYGKVSSIYKFYAIKWNATPTVVQDTSFGGGSGPLFTLQNVVYMADFRTNHQIKIFGREEGSFNLKQTLQFFNATDFSPQDFRMTAVPYYA